MFTQGEIIVRDDLKYPDGAFVVVGLDKYGRLLVQPLGGLGQLALGCRDVARFQSIEPAETIEVYSPGTFTLEGIEENFEGWTDGLTWNGWARPCITREVAERILQASGYRWSYEPSEDALIVTTSPDAEPEHFPAETIELGDGGSATVHFLGAGSWMWENTEPSQGSGRLHQ